MTRTQLVKRSNFLFKFKTATNVTRIGKCQALIFHYDQCDEDLILSYKTIVGIYNRRTATLFVFDYYSRTTIQHIYKAAKILNPMRITWLYRRSDGIIELAVSPHANTYKYTKREYSIIKANDFITFIGNNFRW